MLYKYGRIYQRSYEVPSLVYTDRRITNWFPVAPLRVAFTRLRSVNNGWLTSCNESEEQSEPHTSRAWVIQMFHKGATYATQTSRNIVLQRSPERHSRRTGCNVVGRRTYCHEDALKLVASGQLGRDKQFGRLLPSDVRG